MPFSADAERSRVNNMNHAEYEKEQENRQNYARMLSMPLLFMGFPWYTFLGLGLIILLNPFTLSYWVIYITFLIFLKILQSRDMTLMSFIRTMKIKIAGRTVYRVPNINGNRIR